MFPLVLSVVEKEASDQNGRTYIIPSLVNHIVQEVRDTCEMRGSGQTDVGLVFQVGKEVEEEDESKFFDIDTQLALAKTLVDVLRPRGDDFPTQVIPLRGRDVQGLCSLVYPDMAAYESHEVVIRVLPS